MVGIKNSLKLFAVILLAFTLVAGCKKDDIGREGVIDIKGTGTLEANGQTYVLSKCYWEVTNYLEEDKSFALSNKSGEIQLEVSLNVPEDDLPSAGTYLMDGSSRSLKRIALLINTSYYFGEDDSKLVITSTEDNYALSVTGKMKPYDGGALSDYKISFSGKINK